MTSLLKIGNKIGCGSYGDVHEAVDLKKEQKVAVKIFKDAFDNVQQCMDQPEVKIMTKIKHHNLVGLKKVIYENNKLYLVMELCSMNLTELMRSKEKSRQKFSTDKIRSYMTDVLKAVECLHSHGYLHRDIKPDNILISPKGALKLTDFGTIKDMKDKLPFTNYVSTRWYRAPECILETEKYDEKSDVFALGCLFAEFYKLKPIFAGSSSSDQLKRYIEAMGSSQINSWKEGKKLMKKFWGTKSKSVSPKLQELVGDIPHEALDLLNKMLHINPSKRISLDKVLKHSFFGKKSTILKTNIFETNLASKVHHSENTQEDNRSPEIPEKQYKPRKIIKNYITKLKDRENLDLSRVNEVENENSEEFTPYKSYMKRLAQEKTKSKFALQKEVPQQTNEEFSMAEMYKLKRQSSLAGIINKNSTSAGGMRRISSMPRFSASTQVRDAQPPSQQWRGSEVQHSPVMSSARMNISDSPSTSSGDELDILKRKVEEQKTVSMPSLKNYQAMPIRHNSRSSLSIGRQENPNKIEKYFQDFNGNSILSTMSSSNDIFSNITKNTSLRSSLLSNGHTVRGINAGNQVVFGSQGQNLPSISSRGQNENHLYSQGRQFEQKYY